MHDRISDFYHGKSIFLTGATGFLGSVLLEILLRTLPGIKHVYVLLRPKQGKDLQERKNLIFQKRIFENLLSESPDITDKVRVVLGDINLPGLGLSDEDLHSITEEVSVVIHCAALLSFTLPFKVSIQANVLGTKSVLELCRKLKKCEVLVYTSTIYSNTHLNQKHIEEKTYGLPFSLETVLNDLENKDDDWFAKFLSTNNCKWPNSYTFSKCLAENMLCEEAKDIPVVILRPSIILGTLRGLKPGYIETGFGSIDLPLVVGKGLISVVRGRNIPVPVIPVDIVCNTLIASTWCLATSRSFSPLFVHATTGESSKVDLIDYFDAFQSVFSKNVLPNSFRDQSLIIFENKFLYNVFRLYKDFLPCFVLDAIAYLKGNKSRTLMSVQRNIDSLMEALDYFTTTEREFSTDTIKKIKKLLHPEDREIFYTDLSESSFVHVLSNLPLNLNLYNWKKDKLSPKSRKYSILVNTMITTFIKRFCLFLTIGLTYFTISKILL